MDTRGSAQQADRIHTEKGGIFYEEDVPAPRTGLRSRAACGLRQQARPAGTRAGRWSWWNWDSRTANPEDYARSYDVVSVGNPRPPHVPKSARREVMLALCDARLNP